MTEFNLFAILAVIAGLGLVIFAVVTMTSFVKIAVVLFLIRNALGVQQTPPNLVLYAIALVLTAYVSAPLVQTVHERVNDPSASFEPLPIGKMPPSGQASQFENI